MANVDNLLVLWRKRVKDNLEEIADLAVEDPKTANMLLTEAMVLMECADGLEKALKADRAIAEANPPVQQTPKKEPTFWDELVNAFCLRPPLK